jgi:hypothetical protein
MNVIIVPLLGSRLIVEIGRDTDSILLRRIDRRVKGAAALDEREISGTRGVSGFINLIKQDPSPIGYDLAVTWLTSQNA